MARKILMVIGFVAGILTMFCSGFLFAQTVSTVDRADASYAVSSAELIKKAKDYDGQSVVFKGEIIGEIMPRGAFSWVNIKDGAIPIGIWVENKLIQDIKYTGNYRTTGDSVEIIGIFSRACREHGGDLDIHARAIKIVKAGSHREHKLNNDKFKLILTLSIILCLILILQVYKLVLRKKLAK